MKKETIKRILSSIIIVPIALFFIIKGSIYFASFLFIFFLITSYEWFKMTKNKMHLFLGIIFLLLTSYSAYLLRGTTHKEQMILLFVLLVCVTTDIGGYAFGKIFKGPKLIRISPNKTYSGMIGGYFLSIIFSNIYADVYDVFVSNTLELLITVLLISSVSQLGDLSISYFKRLSKIKNTGNILPGHGGLLDRVDGIIFSVPFAFFYLN